jgi:hypothetical protein
MSAVTTFPAIIVLVGYFSLTAFMKLLKRSEYPLATSTQINLIKLNSFNVLPNCSKSSFFIPVLRAIFL